MTEPVAYMWKTAGGNVLGFQEYKQNTPYPGYAMPLYTAEQLHPRVKMTKKQYDRLMWEKSHTNLLACIDYFFEHDDNYKFGLPGENLMGLLTQEDIARAWLNPEETIEIVRDMKWFVRSKDKNDEGYYSFLNNGIQLTLNWVYSKDKNKPHKEAVSFDNKEQAELWTNPLTEAVQLPVEGE
ncbi:hypothetical protein [Leuconostoc pseudomesenteroides]|uniref:hypothetical protein n=1 Tax=Leuconostoc pseudomesenteroides TaxID=33968 RepID=UPI0039EA54A8